MYVFCYNYEIGRNVFVFIFHLGIKSSFICFFIQDVYLLCSFFAFRFKKKCENQTVFKQLYFTNIFLHTGCFSFLYYTNCCILN